MRCLVSLKSIHFFSLSLFFDIISMLENEILSFAAQSCPVQSSPTQSFATEITTLYLIGKWIIWHWIGIIFFLNFFVFTAQVFHGVFEFPFIFGINAHSSSNFIVKWWYMSNGKAYLKRHWFHFVWYFSGFDIYFKNSSYLTKKLNISSFMWTVENIVSLCSFNW